MLESLGDPSLPVILDNIVSEKGYVAKPFHDAAVSKLVGDI
jgi:hypothetical protein